MACEITEEQQLIEELLVLNEILRLVSVEQRRVPGIKSLCMVICKRKKKVLKLLGGA